MLQAELFGQELVQALQMDGIRPGRGALGQGQGLSIPAAALQKEAEAEGFAIAIAVWLAALGPAIYVAGRLVPAIYGCRHDRRPGAGKEETQSSKKQK